MGVQLQEWKSPMTGHDTRDGPGGGSSGEPGVKALFGEILEVLPDAVAVSRAVRDEHGRAVDMQLLFMNEAARASQKHPPPDEAIGRLCSELWPEMIANGSFAACMRVLDSGIPERGVFEWGDGSTLRPAGYDWRAVRLGTDYLVWVLRDDTERLRALDEARKARQRADAANQAKSEFLSRMSHELRTPLNAILGFTQLLELDQLGEDADQSLEQIHRAGTHLLELINDVLDIARIEAGRMDLATESVSVRGVVTTVFELLQPEADRQDVTLAIDGPGDVLVRADRQRLTQLVLNLVSNAVKYNRRGGSVTANWEVSGGTVSLSITDTGIGIAPDQLELAFVPFERLGADLLGIDGTGVGLTLSRALAERMGGILTAISERGSGSTFTVELPRAELPAPSSDAGEPLNDSRPATAASALRILCIDDNVSNVALMQRVLSRVPNVELLFAGDAALGLELARAHRPHLVLLDLYLPDSAGDDVLREIRHDSALQQTRVAMLSADATERTIRRLLDQGADHYLTKPIDVLELYRLIESVRQEGQR